MQLIDIYEFIHARVVGVLDTFTNPMSFLSPLPLAIAALISLIVILSRQNSNIRTSERAPILSQLFPSRIIFHSSAKIDLWIIIINKGVFFFVPLLGTVLVFYFSQSLSSLTETRGQSSSGGFLWMIAFTVYSTLVWDFLASFSHYLKHKVPFLWEFHKVHHSAQVLTPLTALRRHPFEAFFSAVLVGVGLAISTMAWILVTGMPGLSLQIGGVMMTIYLWRVLGYNIRHSHLWISYGGFWNKIFISPAHHHIHHSNSEKHYDTNFGHIFSFWDYLFGTILHPEDVKEGAVEFGINHHEDKNLQSLPDIYIRPIIMAASHFKPKARNIKHSKIP